MFDVLRSGYAVNAVSEQAVAQIPGGVELVVWFGLVALAEGVVDFCKGLPSILKVGQVDAQVAFKIYALQAGCFEEGFFGRPVEGEDFLLAGVSFPAQALFGFYEFCRKA